MGNLKSNRLVFVAFTAALLILPALMRSPFASAAPRAELTCAEVHGACASERGTAVQILKDACTKAELKEVRTANCEGGPPPRTCFICGDAVSTRNGNSSDGASKTSSPGGTAASGSGESGSAGAAAGKAGAAGAAGSGPGSNPVTAQGSGNASGEKKEPQYFSATGDAPPPGASPENQGPGQISVGPKGENQHFYGGNGCSTSNPA
jgi:hypothetical protein